MGLAQAVGDQIVNPLTGAQETVLYLTRPSQDPNAPIVGVVTAARNSILTITPVVSQTFTKDPSPAAGDEQTYRIKTVTTGANGRITSYTYVQIDSQNNEIAGTEEIQSMVSAINDAEWSRLTSTTGPEGPAVPPSPGAGDVNTVTRNSTGRDGRSGSDGYGLRVCIPFIGCATLGTGGSSGESGGDANDIDIAVAPSGAFDNLSGQYVNPPSPPDQGNISLGTGRAGIYALSQGGSGGKGGDAYGNFEARPGGQAGKGGDITVTNSVDINGNGTGIFASSQGGTGGPGGTGFIAGTGGLGGPSAQAGRVSVTNDGAISTTGREHFGILAQSLGGRGGAGGAAYGIVGDANAGSAGGIGAAVTVTNRSTIRTTGIDAHGILAQSIGGNGGNFGDAKSLVSNVLGSASDQNPGGGAGGAVTVTLTADGQVLTFGRGSAGIVAQSIGGGGGNAGSSYGLVAMGGQSGTGGDGGNVTVTAQAGSSIVTAGALADGIVAQAIGGGGGNGGDAGGALAMGSGGSAGGNGGSVNVTLGGRIETGGNGSRGIVAQSIGGGGGNGGDSQGILSLGGSGTAASAGGSVFVNIGTSGRIDTSGNRASAIEAQSIGGGGGSGGSAGGLITLGGSGAGGGEGGSVDVDFAGIANTAGDDSTGIIAQSIGGGGGNGGGATSGSALFGLAVGGNAGQGGSGAAVSVDFTDRGPNTLPVITTNGERSYGILAQSVGGGGGNGGQSMQFTGGLFGAASVAVGGKGGGGGAGGAVSLSGAVSVTTGGDNSDGLVAQSIGGGGGNGGFAFSGAAAGGPVAGAISLGIGGQGGNGGNGGDVTLRAMGGSVSTTGAFSEGILAQSIAGGGGNGGFAVSGAVAGGEGAGAVSLGIGGTGGSGADRAGTVTAGYTGSVTTGGAQSSGIVLQSVGGGGGTGGFAVAGALAGSSGGGVGVSVGLGGAGGDGGSGGRVVATLDATVTTQGAQSAGIVAQSVGGGGGSGGMAIAGALNATGGSGGAVAVGLGGSGGGGGAADAVDLSVAGSVTTRGAQANAVSVQSIGGGGGAGGMSIAGGASVTAGSGGAAAVGLGGNGGTGNRAGAVTVTNTADVTTEGADSAGLVVQSLGGGGGAGGMSIAGGLSAAASNGGSLAFGMGGTGGSGGTGGAVTATSSGSITTQGQGSTALIVQSVGGGGGAGGMNVSGAVSLASGRGAAVAVGLGGRGGSGAAAGTVSLTQSDAITTEGAGSAGIVAQSVGGGGGAGGMNVAGSMAISNDGSAAVTVGLGGRGGSGGVGANVTASVAGDVTTRGAGSDAVTVQSVGGGGGAGGMNFSGTMNVATGSGTLGSVTLGIGGSGGSGGAAGAVSATVTGRVTAGRLAADAGSNGILAQSVGGGGGSGAINVTGDVTLQSTGGSGAGLAIGLGAAGGSGGDASEVRLTVSSAAVAAYGQGTTGVMAQSVGGGGGAGGVNLTGALRSTDGVTLGIGGRGGAAGVGGTVIATVDAPVTVAGDQARGVVAQSVGGGGGVGGTNISAGITIDTEARRQAVIGIGGDGGTGNAAGAVTLVQSGAVRATGNGAQAVLAQSVGGGGGAGGVNVAAGINHVRGSAQGGGVTSVVALGGSGGAAGDGAAVALTSDGAITAGMDAGEGARGLVAQSVGGGGGSGTFNLGFAYSGGGDILGVTVGGSGGAAGNGGAVTVTRGQTRQSSLTTRGNNAVGLLAQSIGGGGGDAGINMLLGLSFSETQNGPRAVTMALGGDGAAPGTGGAVTVNHAGEITTFGAASTALAARSIGGGGGDAAMNMIGGNVKDATASVSLALGGAPTGGADGGAVTLRQVGTILTYGAGSRGVDAQSIGGGGGNAAANTATVFGKRASLTVKLGQSGGVGGNGGAVTVTTEGRVATTGEEAAAVWAQSIGGGGGNSGTSGGGVSTSSGTGAAKEETSTSVDIGLTGATGGDGGRVEVTTAGTITTGGARSYGLFAQSIGGGGGNAGMVMNFNLSDSNAHRLGLGGSGGTGGLGGAVSVSNAAEITTNGAEAIGIFGQSVGGGGGNGSVALTFIKGAQKPGAATTTISQTIGGSGGTGGIGGSVGITNSGRVLTFGRAAHGILAQSIGGGGGQGGSALVLGGAYDGDQRSMALVMGGAGGSGATGGDVTVRNSGSIRAEGADAAGIMAQSIGGGGGNGGMAATLELSGTEGANDRMTVALGGAGGSGGQGGAVSVTNDETGRIETMGAAGYGILAQSIGGGGGNGGASIVLIATRNAAEEKEDNLTFGAIIGGSGGSGNAAAAVDVGNAGSIRTAGDAAHGVLAQSIGGGGGNGGFALNAGSFVPVANSGKMLTLGGSGGDGNDGGAVSVTNSGSIHTSGVGAHGIVAQSIGGGGGAARLGLAGGIEAPVAALVGGAAYSLGMTGGTGGQGGTVTVTHTGSITTTGAGSRGIVAESINGGGGDLEISLSNLTLAPGASVDGPTLTLLQGASATQNMAAGAVTVTGRGTIRTTGADGAGGSVQAIGGGGGTTRVTLSLGRTEDTAADGGLGLTLGAQDSSGTGGGAITSRHQGAYTAAATNAPALLLQSIGGGGGRMSVWADDPDTVLSFARSVLGGTGGSDNAGGRIQHDQSGDVFSDGAFSFGILAQSVGGGGGWLTWRRDAPIAPVVAAAPMAPAPTSRMALLAVPAPDFTLGGDGVVASNGADTVLTQTGAAATLGDFSTAILLQSIGAGGGVTVAAGAGAPVTALLGGRNGAAGDGGAVSLTRTGAVQAQGVQSHGIFLQSIGGGGGALFTDAPEVGVTLSADNSGSGGAVTLRQTGDVQASGARVYGVFAQSLGGGGGFIEGRAEGVAGQGRFAGTAGGAGNGGALDLRIDGSVLAMGDGSVALFAQSAGRVGGDITLDLPDPEARMIGGAGGIGVQIDGGASNRLTLRGLLTTRDGAAGQAIQAGAGDDRVESFGVIFGSVRLGAGANGLTNRAGGSLLAGAALDVGAGNLVLNEGLWSAGDVNRVQRTTLTGDYRQTAAAEMVLDLDFGAMSADRLDVSGAVDLAGRAVVNLIDPATQVAKARAGVTDTVIVTAAPAMLRTALSLTAPQTAVASYTLENAASDRLVLRTVVDYAAKGLGSRNRMALGTAVNVIQTQQASPGFAPVATRLFFVPDVAALGATYDLLAGSGVVTGQEVAFGAQDRFVGRLMDRLALGARPEGVAEGWASLGYGAAALSGDAATGSFAADMRGGLFAAGMDVAVSDRVTLGFALGSGRAGYEVADVATSGNLRTDHLGVYGSYRDDALRLSGSFAAASVRHDYSRSAVVPGVSIALPGGTLALPALWEDLTGRQQGNMVTGALEIGYAFDTGATEVMPFVGLSRSVLRLEGFSETRADGAPSQLGLRFEGATITSTPVTLGVEVRHDARTASGGRVSGWLRGAWEHDLSTERGLTAGFLQATDGRFGVLGTAPARDAIKLGAGLSMELNRNTTAHFGVNGRFTESGSDYNAELGIQFRW